VPLASLPSPSLQSIRELLSPYSGSKRVFTLIQPELTGGTTTREQLAALDELPEVDAIKVSGLSNAELEYLATRYPKKFAVIELWKCPQLSDLSPIEGLTTLTHALLFHNRKATCLWDFQKTPKLVGLDFTDFTKLDDLKDLRNARSLRELEFGNMIWNRAKYLSLEPLAFLIDLRRLSFNAISVGDSRIQPLANLSNLTELWFPASLFTREQLAWLRARLPATVQSEVLQSHQSRAAAPTKTGRSNDAKVNGRGERAFDSRKGRELLAVKAQEFQALVERFEQDPIAEPQL
jgi:hypothetical protein